MAGEIRGDDHKKIMEHYQQPPAAAGKMQKGKGVAKGEAPERVHKGEAPERIHGDRIISSKEEEVTLAKPPIKPSEPKDPKLPPPSTREIKDESLIKEMAKVVEVNPWMANPSYMGAFLSKLSDLFEYTSQQRFKEHGLKIKVDAASFKGRMESAQLAKSIKDTEAQKMFLDAAKSFVSAGVGVLQARSMMNARKDAELKSKESFDKGIEERQAKVKTLEEKGKKLELKQKEFKERNVQIGENRQDIQDPYKEKIKLNKEELGKAKEKLSSLTTKKEQSTQQTITREIEISRQKFEIFKQLTDSAFSVSGGILTSSIGTKEKERAEVEAFVDVLNKMAEGVKQARDDLPNFRDKVLQMMEQTSTENMRAHLQKG